MLQGCLCYADDVVLIGPCQQAMQMMLATVENFALRYNISFSTDPDPKKSKSKCIYVVGKKRNLSKPSSLLIWVMSYMKVAPWTTTLLLRGPNSSADLLKLETCLVGQHLQTCWEYWKYIAQPSMDLCYGIWGEKRQASCTRPGTPQSSWSGLVQGGQGHSCYSKYSYV